MLCSDHAATTAQPPPMVLGRASSAERLRAMAENHLAFVNRVLRRLLPPDAADDATQRTFLIAAGRIDDIEPHAERAWLFQTAVRVASHVRRSQARRREVGEEQGLDQHDAASPPDEQVIRQQRLRMLDWILEQMDDDLREVFVLFELEGLGSPEIAPILGIPVGTVASRLRRAREAFQAEARRLRSRLEFQGGGT